MVIWLIGISGAGKTTLGLRLRDWFTQKKIPTYLLDGDEVRAVFDGDLGYSRADREANIKRIILAAYVLDRCGITVVVCNISPFENLRKLAREKINGYHEIYLKKDLAASRRNDVKGIYAHHEGRGDIIGVDIEFDEPLFSDLTVCVDSESVEESCSKIIKYIESENVYDTEMGH